MTLIDQFIKQAIGSGASAEIATVENLAYRLAALTKTLGVASVVMASCEDSRLAELLNEALADTGCRLLPQESAKEADLGITFPHALVADTGSLVLHSGQKGGMLASLLPPAHLAIARKAPVFANLAELLESFGGVLPSRFTLITGPSRTGDIEATMTTCVHGPGKVAVWVVD